MADEVFVYALSTCPWCRKTKEWFTNSNVPFEFVDIDLLDGEDGDAASDKAYELSGGRRYPVVLMNGECVVGFNPQRFADLLKTGSL